MGIEQNAQEQQPQPIYVEQQTGYGAADAHSYQIAPENCHPYPPPPPPHHPHPHVEIINTSPGVDVRILHSISIVCCLLSLLLSPLIEIIPVILFTVYNQQLFRPRDIHVVRIITADLITTWVVFIAWIVMTIVFTVMTYGFFAYFFIFLIFYVIVIVQLTRARRFATTQFIVVDPQHHHHPQPHQPF
eukprot:CAMPEP_0184660122 /NCGR_PEP_ID=MMETSP0308-20130426/32537_2 /TAXON_ID=38269 /ORGANISM="Gloeochaete witrockiana, Strain SAG 46.84" /LENGTH=187 /DNA_ID=CAMNT_0027100475 /DNA_START=20 /DNA_END=583 /DNA_ORIENTATION=-